ncbi:hypothetical protein, partial [Photobacterium kishitanii]|uniref:hypothetical protein n=1 Tax=Photobacterium kishitanii TaxID=318456 RepID=UPI001C1F2BD1
LLFETNKLGDFLSLLSIALSLFVIFSSLVFICFAYFFRVNTLNFELAGYNRNSFLFIFYFVG